jgi:hypothetical protein
MDKDCSIFVNAAAIILVPADIPKAKTDDLMNSVLLAQLVANKNLQHAPTANWYDAYVAVLGNFWISSSRTRQDRQPEKESVGSPLEWIDALPLGTQRAQIIAALSRVARLPGSLPAMGIMRRHAQQPYEPGPIRPVRLLVIVAQSPVSITGCYLRFNTRHVLDPNPWGQRFNAQDIDGCVSACYFQAHLSEILFAPAREVIARKIETVVGDNVVDVTKAIDALDLVEGAQL